MIKSVSKVFQAKYVKECEACGWPVEVGEEACFFEGDFIHAEHLEEYENMIPSIQEYEFKPRRFK